MVLVVTSTRYVPSRWCFGGPRASFMMQLERNENESMVERSDSTRVQAELGEPANEEENIHEEFMKRVTTNRARVRASTSKSGLSNLEVGDFNLVAHCDNQELCQNMVSTWIRPRKVMSAGKV